MRFLRPDLADWLAAVPVAFVLWFLGVRVKQHLRRRAAIGQPLRALSRLSGPWADASTLVAALLAVGMLTFAVTRPQLLLEIQLPEYESHDLVLMLDRSVSMYAQDIKPSRFNRAIDEIRTFLAHKPEIIDRVALVGFAETPMVLSRLTADEGSLMFYLEWIEDDARIFWGTDIGAALKSALELGDKDPQKTPKIFVVLSDGEDYGPNLSEALTELQRRGARVHAVGIGGEADVPIPVFSDGKPTLLVDERDRVITTRFSSGTLTNIASLTGGRYYRSETGEELTRALRDIVAFERKLTGWKASVDYRDLYRPALAVGLLATFALLLKL